MKIDNYIKEKVSKLGMYVVIFMTTILLQACGGSNSIPTYTISADTNSIDFSNEFLQVSDDTFEIQVTFEGPGLLVGYPPGVQPPPWFQYRAENVTATSATIIIEVINAQFINADLYTSTLRLTTGEEDNFNYVNKDIDISLLVWQLSTNTDLVSYRSTLGDTSVAEQTIELTSDTNEWTAATDVDWLTLDVASGTGSATLTLSADLTGFTEVGLQQGNIILTETTTGDSKLLPVELGLDNVYLYADQANIAFTSTQNITATSYTVTIDSNHESPQEWSATTEAAWLTLTPAGDQLTITADAAMVPANETTTASVVISATNDVTIISEIITVNLYNNDLTSESNTIANIIANNDTVLTSPTLPQLYVGVDNTIQIYHNYTGELLASTVISPEATLLEQFIVHPDGSYLLAKAVETVENDDGTSTEVVHRYNINLSDYTFTEITAASIVYEPVKFVRLIGRYFVISQTLEYADENLQQLYWDAPNAFFAAKIDVASQANTLWALDNSTVSYKRFQPNVNDFTTDKIITSMTHEYHPETLADGDFINDFIVSNNEANIYAISATSEWVSFDNTITDETAFIDNGLLENNADIVTFALSKNKDSQPHYLRANQAAFTGFYIDIYNDIQVIEKTVDIGVTQPSTIEVASDNNRMILNNINDQSIGIVDL